MCNVKCVLGHVKQQYRDGAELVLRVVASIFMFTHGWGKFCSFSEKMNVFPDPIGLGSPVSLALATFAEFFCALLLLVGLLTRFASFTLLMTMLVAGVIFHFPDPFAKKELALLYAVIFLYFTVVGGNRYSVDEYLRRKFLK